MSKTNDIYETVLADLPKNASDRLKNCPSPGQGVHQWIFTTALSLTSYLDDDQIVEILNKYISCPGREQEIINAVPNARTIAKGEGGSESRVIWPAVDYQMAHYIVINSPIRLKDLRSLSPVDLSSEDPKTEEILDTLFRDNPLLCFGEEVNVFSTHPRECWRGKESTFQFIVANPMTKERGLTREGKESERCLDNTGPRIYLPIEFDISEEGAWAPYIRKWQAQGITVHDANAALLVELATKALPRFPLVLAVHSGGKSIHGWFSCAGFTENEIRPFMARAVHLGADIANWTKCQLVRMPDGTRRNGIRQRVHYFAPGALPSEESWKMNHEPVKSQEGPARPAVNEEIQQIQKQLAAPPALLPREIQNPVVMVAGKPELILPSNHTSFIECGEQCFSQLAKTERFFRQGSLLVELVECGGAPKLVELSVEAFRSRLEMHFSLRGIVIRNWQPVLAQKLCSQDNAKALLATEAALRHLPTIQTIVNSPVFAEDESGRLTVLNQGYHPRKGGIYVLKKRCIDTDIPIDEAVQALSEILIDFSFLTESDKSRCIAGLISPALRFGGLLDADFPLDLCEADQSQTGKSFRMKLICVVYGERPFVVVLPSESKKGVGSVDESLSEALLSGSPFIALDNLRGTISNQLLESAIRGEGVVSVRRSYSRTTQIETNHVCWMATSNRAETTLDLANRSIITRLRKCPWNYRFRRHAGDDLLTHVEKQSDYFLSCIFAVVREWQFCGKPRTDCTDHDFREWSQTVDWIIQNICGLPPLLEGHRGEQLRIASPALSFLRDVAIVVSNADECQKELSALEIAILCETASIDVPGCAPGAGTDQGSRRIGSLFSPLFKESEIIDVEGFRVTRSKKKSYDDARQENRESKFYSFIQIHCK